MNIVDIVKGLKRIYGNDFQIWYDTTLKRHYWTVGYFGGGAINISRSVKVAEEYANLHSVGLDSVVVDEIRNSSRYKYFKVFYSDIVQTQIDLKDHCEVCDNVWNLLTS